MLKKPHFFNLLIVFTLLAAALVLPPDASVKAFSPNSDVFINELHYDNAGTDMNEFVEIAAPAGTNLSGWQLVLYNGSSGELYNTIALSGTVADQKNGFGVLAFDTPGIQNGAPDGLALVSPSNDVVQFLSYEGSFTAADGPAVGLLSTDIGFAEGSSTPADFSLQLSGKGNAASDFVWIEPFQASPGTVNLMQTFATTVFINELHYDNQALDQNEFIEVAGQAGTDLTDWQFVLYDGVSGTLQATIPLSGTLPDQSAGYGVLSFPLERNTLGNGTTGIALVNAYGRAVQFLSYEGTFTAANGPAAGLTSHDIGISESNQTAVGDSLQLTGLGGSTYEDFTWAGPSVNSAGFVNFALDLPFILQLFSEIVDYPPFVTGTVPAKDGFDFAVDANLSVVFTEAITTEPGWFSLDCSLSGDIAYAVSTTDDIVFTIDPLEDFAEGELCTATVHAGSVRDLDHVEENPYADYSWQFSTVGVRVHHIQGQAHLSIFNGKQVKDVPGIVTAITSNSFYLQEPVPDTNPATSEGILVYTGSTSAVAVGDSVLVSGKVSEYRPGGSGGLANLTTTEITSPTVTVLSSANPLPTAARIGTGDLIPPMSIIDNDSSGSVETSGIFDPSEDGIDFYESLEGMLVSVHNAVAVSGTNNYGEIAVVSENHAGLLSSRGALVLQSTDFNPERIILDDTLIGYGSMPVVSVGDQIADPLGVMDYSFGNFKLYLTEVPAVVNEPFTAETAAAPDGLHLQVASLNVENLAATDDPARFALLADQIVNNLHSPDIIGLQEIQDDNGTTDDGTVSADLTMATLIDAVTAAGGPVYAYRQINPLDNMDGGAPGGNIRVGFLFQPDRVSFVDRAGGDAVTPVNVLTNLDGSPYLNVSPGRIAPLDSAFDESRKPLVGEFTYKNETLFLVVNHFNSKGGDHPLFGRWQPPVLTSETQRLAQAALVNQFVSDLLTVDSQAKVVVLGDMNDFTFSAPLSVLAYGADTTAELENLHDLLPENERYTYIYDGNAQTLDHILVSPALSGHQSTVFDIVHLNAERAASDSLRSSDHEPLLAGLYVNTAPLAQDRSGTGLEENSIVVTLSATDLNDDPLSFSVIDEPANGTYSVVGNQLTYTPALDFNGSDFLTYVASDGLANSNTARVDFTVTAVNDAPGFVKGTDITIGEDSPAQTIPGWATGISAGPADEQPLQTVAFHLSVDNPALFAVQPAVTPDGTLTFTPAANTYGLATIQIWLEDNGGTVYGGLDTSPTQSFTITIEAVNDEPAFTGGADQNVAEDSGPQTVLAWATGISAGPNEDDQNLTFILQAGDETLFADLPAIDPASGNLTFTPADDASGATLITVTLTDDGGTANGGDDTSPQQTFTITIGEVNDLPSANPQTLSVAEDGSLPIVLTGTDQETQNSSLTFQVVQSPQHGSLTGTAPNLTYTPDSNFNGEDSFTFIVNDGTDDSLPAEVSITVTPVNDAPIGVDDDNPALYSVFENEVLSVAAPGVLANDSDPDQDSISAVLGTATDNGILLLNPDGSFTYTPQTNYVGPDSFTYFVTDGDLQSAEVTVTITVLPGIPVTGSYDLFLPLILR